MSPSLPATLALALLSLPAVITLQEPFGRRQGMNVAISDAASVTPLSRLQQHLYSFQPGGPRSAEVLGGGSPILSEQCRAKLRKTRRTLRVHLRSERKGDLAMGNKYVNRGPCSARMPRAACCILTNFPPPSPFSWLCSMRLAPALYFMRTRAYWPSRLAGTSMSWGTCLGRTISRRLACA